ncbi:MFS transporter [Leucobacter sp. CSA1]|uniref:MFS transporter n=2 Tax=Leucobacter chromiisoli TaxID=2796471 RepID=A0A934Q5Z3_9MICO|nr:MFS transporter [Leucobacter chromiisoli]
MIALFCAGLATFAQLYSPQGLLPEIARAYGVGESASSWAVGAATIGVALGVLPWARLSDRVGRVRAMRWAMVCAMVIGLIAPFAPGFVSMIAIRGAEGVALAGLPAIAVTALAETIHPRALGAAVGSYVAGTTLGGLSGRIVAGLAGDPLGWRWGMATVAVLAAVATVAFLVLIPPTALRPGPGMSMVRATLQNLRTPGVAVLVAQGFLLMGGFVAAYNYLTFRLEQAPFGLSLAQVSWLFLAYLAGAATSRWVWRIARRRAPTAVLLGCVAVMLVGLAATLAPRLPIVILGLVLFTGGFFGAHSIASGLISRRAGEARSQAPPLYNLGYYAGSSLLGWLGGLAFAAWGWGGTAATIAAAAALAGLMAWGYARSNGGIAAVDA